MQLLPKHMPFTDAALTRIDEAKHNLFLLTVGIEQLEATINDNEEASVIDFGVLSHFVRVTDEMTKILGVDNLEIEKTG